MPRVAHCIYFQLCSKGVAAVPLLAASTVTTCYVEQLFHVFGHLKLVGKYEAWHLNCKILL